MAMSDFDVEEDISSDPSDYSDYSDLDRSSSSSSTSHINRQHNGFHSIYHNQHPPMITNLIKGNNILQIKQTNAKIKTDLSIPMNIDHKPCIPSISRNCNPPSTNYNHDFKHQQNFDFLLAKAMTLYPQLRWNTDNEWCRFCGARASSSFYNSPWGPKQLCSTHHEQYKQRTLDLSLYKEPHNIESAINKTECTEQAYLVDIVLKYEHTKRRSSRNKTLRMKIESVSDDNSQDEEYVESQAKNTFECRNKSDETFKCNECDRLFSKKWYLRNHVLNMHTPNKDKPFQCRFCTYGAAVKWSLDCHEAIHLNARQYKCPHTQCDKAFNVKQELQRHVANNHTKPFKCDECDKRFGSAKYLQSHRISIHTKNEHKPFRCKYCDYGAASEYIIKKHELSHSAVTPYKCVRCNKSFRTDRYLQTHLERVHVEDKYKPLQCDICAKRFLGKINLKNHYKCHDANCFHQCDQCEYSTPDSKRLKKHKQIHSGEKPFECNVCHKRFRLWTYVLTHKQNVHKKKKKKKIKCV
eukprot:855869_1